MPIPAMDLSTGKEGRGIGLPKSSTDSAYMTERILKLLPQWRHDWHSRFWTCSSGMPSFRLPQTLHVKSTCGTPVGAAVGGGSGLGWPFSPGGKPCRLKVIPRKGAHNLSRPHHADKRPN